jgi:AraC family transcriptional regulator of adaptative response/methylated-DNA-[protein]-cysteine methyltransferase
MNTSTVAAETFHFGYGESKLGAVLVAQSERGVAAIFLGEDRAKLRRELGQAFGHARVVEDQAGLVDVISNVVTLADAPQLGPTFPLDLRGSELELAVWAVLQTIPPAETRTYGTLAKALSFSATAQEVGAACAANVLAVAVPCHRVVKADGSISGYRWGVRRKRHLIKVEAAA